MPCPVAIRFVGVLPCRSAEAAARDCIAGLGRACAEVAGWDVCVRPPLALWEGAGFAVRVQARLDGGGLISTRSQAGDLLDALRDAFDGMEQLLRQEFSGQERAPAWLPRMPGAIPVAPA